MTPFTLETLAPLLARDPRNDPPRPLPRLVAPEPRQVLASVLVDAGAPLTDINEACNEASRVARESGHAYQLTWISDDDGVEVAAMRMFTDEEVAAHAAELAAYEARRAGIAALSSLRHAAGIAARYREVLAQHATAAVEAGLLVETPEGWDLAPEVRQ